MRDYIVTHPVDHDGQRYSVGSTIGLDIAAASPLLDLKAIAEPGGFGSALAEGLAGSDYLPTLIRLAEDLTVPQTDVVRQAFDASGLDPAGWNALAEGDREQRITAALLALRDPAAAPEREEPQDGKGKRRT